MAIKHIKHLHELLPNNSSNAETNSEKTQTGSYLIWSKIEPLIKKVIVYLRSKDLLNLGSNWQCPQEVESFKNGFNECLAEAVHFLVEKEHIPPENPLCSRLVANLKRYLDSKNQQKSSSEPDSDYSSMRSESSAANSEVSSIVSNPSTTTQRKNIWFIFLSQNDNLFNYRQLSTNENSSFASLIQQHSKFVRKWPCHCGGRY